MRAVRRAGQDILFSSRRRHTRFDCDWSSDVCSSDLVSFAAVRPVRAAGIVYAVALAAACRGGSARKPAAAGVAGPDTGPPPDTVNLYAAAGANALSSVAARARPPGYEIGRASCRGRG